MMTEALYGELRRMAHRECRRAGSPATWQTTAVLNEAYIKLYRRGSWENREHFLGVAATAMRHILIDAARARLTAKRGAGAVPIEELDWRGPMAGDDAEMIRLGDALKDLEALDPQLARLVDCRFFAGLDEAETGRVLGVSDRTVRRWWLQARAWLHGELSAG
ncbi:ECF-type sigma factor [Sphingomonas sp.]|uniref:ECF-type sigma factor n=1 Tax=Sphingomonas sp. TaxID=28214 RepID=UPI0035B263B9